MTPHLNDYRSPTPEQLAQLEEAERLYTQVESFLRNLPRGFSEMEGDLFRQALFRLRESETWTKELIKWAAQGEDLPREQLPRTRSGSYLLE
jgi:hypothetical protein